MSYNQGTIPGSSTWPGAIDNYFGTATTGILAITVPFGVTMRSSPTVTIWDATGGSGTAHAGTVYKGAYNQAASIMNASATGFAAYCATTQSATEMGFQYTASSEL